ncbi:nitroreductase/quinone reductase family protein [[Mycobacterium] wendilense]|uniref:Nitroreductase/quinone reductase family protein n=1 Tax=[Mycobacterium] wendilense TaxID=3064284 RepID=A0ABM9MHU1_9MYCO|nr:nitroreductase/quinone reductase family protein [Mycolicibacterium sp. MU0050]CAJ1585577.1 nitroreductase/quinone reductase family protein [Mycolicibacterium sp. MU0050]
MAYLKQNWFTAKVLNRIAMATGLAGAETLTVTRRTTGEPQKIPVATIVVDGDRYVVSTRGESHWVKNVRATPQVGLRNRSGLSRYTAVEIPVDARPAIIEAYRSKLGKVVEGYFRDLPDAADHPVFKLSPA